MAEEMRSALRTFAAASVVLLMMQLGFLGLRRDPLGDLVLNKREPMTNAVAAVPSEQAASSDQGQMPGKVLGGVPSTMPPGRVPGMPGMMPGMMAGGMPGMPMGGGPTLPAAVQAQVERITQSEILGPVMRPLPMALLGIAGEDAFMRAPSGQTGLMRVGDEMGGLRLLRIGTNRVLVEHENQQKELMVYSGFGGDSLLKGSGSDAVGGTPAMNRH